MKDNFMTPNRSLQISATLLDFKRHPNLDLIRKYLPHETILEYDLVNQKRDRVFNTETTLLMMLLSSLQHDKSLTNAVSIYSSLHQAQAENIKEAIENHRTDTEKTQPKQSKRRRRISKSKLTDISLNSSAYSQARSKLPRILFEQLYLQTTIHRDQDDRYSWKNMNVFITDGTYFTLQDNQEIRKQYDSSGGSEYPQALMQVLIHRGSGRVMKYLIANRHKTELLLLYQMLKTIPSGSLLLADDLYNTYAIFSLLQQRGIHIIVPGKRERNYEVMQKIGEGDEIVKLKRTAHPDWLEKEVVLPESLLLRRIEISNPADEKQTLVFYTTLLDYHAITKTEITTQFQTRWDIEITIREIKIIMDLKFIRGKSEDMIQKEILSALIAYNIVRTVIEESTDKGAFPPETDIFQTILAGDQPIHVDSKGRVYNRWSSGRLPKIEKQNKSTAFS